MYEEEDLDDNATKMEAHESDTRKYTLSLKGDGMTVDREIDEGTALEVVALVMTGGTAVEAGDGIVVRHSVPRPRRGGQSLREYIDEVEAKRNPEVILAIAKYISNETGKNFTRDDVRSRFQEAAEPVPGNYGRDFRWTMRNGWIAAVVGAQNEHYVTGTGDKALNEKFSAEIKKKTGVAKGRRGGKRGAKRTSEIGS